MPDAAIDPTFILANQFEAALWIVMAGVMAMRFSVRREWSTVRIVGASTLLLFGLSDLVECTTGAWWRPWWLLIWKATCVVALLAWMAKEWIESRRQKNRAAGATLLR